jgi:hypothetical protein
MKNFGLGDLAYYIFRPAVYFTDWIWGTDMKHCELCKARRKRWNIVASTPVWQLVLFVTICGAVIFWWTR